MSFEIDEHNPDHIAPDPYRSPYPEISHDEWRAMLVKRLSPGEYRAYNKQIDQQVAEKQYAERLTAAQLCHNCGLHSDDSIAMDLAIIMQLHDRYTRGNLDNTTSPYYTAYIQARERLQHDCNKPITFA